MTTTLSPSIRQALFENAPNLPWQRSAMVFDKFVVEETMVTVAGGSRFVHFHESLINDDELFTRLLTCARARVEQDDLAEIKRLAHSSRAGSEDIESDKSVEVRIQVAMRPDGTYLARREPKNEDHRDLLVPLGAVVYLVTATVPHPPNPKVLEIEGVAHSTAS